ncbi:MAG: PorT family protein [Paludibacter sp.]|nr:PorT family protein [Paludibacter sp.]
MKSKHPLILLLLLCTTTVYAQLGIKAGINLANEIKSFAQQDIQDGFSSKNLTGYQIGLIYQAMPKKSGLGVEISALLSQKGSTFSDSVSTTNFLREGYTELNYLEVPFNLRYRLTLGFIGIYGFGGIYGGYALNGKTVDETANTTENEPFASFMDRVDYGLNFGAGLELFNKIQLGATWSQGIKNTASSTIILPLPTTNTNRVFSVNLVYLF